MKKLMILLAAAALTASAANAQKIAIKNNFLADLTTSPNLAVELGYAKRFSTEIYYSLNLFKYSANSKFMHHLVMPEFRYWLCESFNGTFFGLHGFWGMYNVDNVKIPMAPNLEKYRYEGQLYGAGVTIGHQWILGKRWNLEASVGGGYIHVDYDCYEAQKCGKFLKNGKLKILGLTRTNLSIVFFFN